MCRKVFACHLLISFAEFQICRFSQRVTNGIRIPYQFENVEFRWRGKDDRSGAGTSLLGTVLSGSQLSISLIWTPLLHSILILTSFAEYFDYDLYRLYLKDFSPIFTVF